MVVEDEVNSIAGTRVLHPVREKIVDLIRTTSLQMESFTIDLEADGWMSDYWHVQAMRAANDSPTSRCGSIDEPAGRLASMIRAHWPRL